MKRRRAIAGTPVRTASEAWNSVCGLLASTLERSSAIPEGSVAKELAPLDGLGSALIAGGHLETDGLVLVDEGLHVTIVVLTSDAALAVDDDLGPVPGGVGATEGWMLHIPTVDPLQAVIATAVAKSSHLSAEPPPDSPPERRKTTSRESLLDLHALRRLGDAR